MLPAAYKSLESAVSNRDVGGVFLGGLVGLIAWSLVLGVIVGISYLSHLIWVAILKEKDQNQTTTTDQSRNQPTICLEENGNHCLAFDEYYPVLKKVCNAIDSDDPTFNAMKTNFDNAILHETLKLNGNSKNFLKHEEKSLIL